ncbi:isoprenylcysteine carboxylmethyltransferase family protein [Mycobacterium helveticum]|uniref:Isoprenylcysteine carboxylmethyltransferase family protein n=1 Tax=Mycobacterium helveticum TaxID=2592811 RepID=A0A557WYR9_9MYCO|nr:isoprenylcysteine carboxylmethyltransferase family protein [Mycobacterium helveticum]TVS78416.1 isoprenylcysteine carboxylmethyltransferase family protein [Mycobacterium helveticum]
MCAAGVRYRTDEGGSVKTIPKLLVFGLVEFVVFGLMLFVPAGTFEYWQAWVFLVVVAVSAWTPAVYLLRTNPVALQARMRGGPAAEGRTAQKVVIAGLYLSLAAMVVVSTLDHRFGWSPVPTAICLVGDVVVAVGLGVVGAVVIQNSYAAATVRVKEGQTVVSTGLYGLVRHPMYTGNVIMMVGIPLALGSYWGLVLVVPGVIALAWRIRDEEKLLRTELDGYREYTQKVRYRLVPSVW